MRMSVLALMPSSVSILGSKWSYAGTAQVAASGITTARDLLKWSWNAIVPYATSGEPTIDVAALPLVLDIWLMVFDYLEGADLQSLSLTSKVFYHLTRPLILGKVRLYTYTDRYAQLSEEEEAQILRRLECLSSRRVAPMVRECAFHFAPDPEEAIVAAIFSVLPRLRNLITLSLYEAEITPARLKAIAALTHMETLNVSSCPLYVSSTPRIPLKRLAVTDEPRWISAADPDVLEELTLRIVGHVTAADLPAGMFPRLKVIRTLGTCVSMPYFPALLSKAPHVERLDVSFVAGDPRLCPPMPASFTSLHNLKAFNGPDYVAPLLASSQAIRRLELWESADAGRDGGMIDVLGRLEHLHGHVEVLKLHIVSASPELFKAVSSFTRLCVLELEIASIKSVPPQDTKIAFSSLSPRTFSADTLERFHLSSATIDVEFESRAEVALLEWCRQHPRLLDACVAVPGTVWKLSPSS